MKKIICFLLAAMLLFGILPVYADEALVFLNEDFNNFGENFSGEMGNVDIMTGVDSRIIKDADGNKAVYSKAWGEGAKVKINFEAPDNNGSFVYSAKIKISGSKTSGKFFQLSDSTSSVIFLSMAPDGSLKLSDGKVIGGFVYNKWNEISVVVNWEIQMYEIWINGKCKLSNHYFTKANYLPMKEIQFSINEPESGYSEFYIDDVRGYRGSSPFDNANFPVNEINSEVFEFEALKTLDITPQLFKEYDFENGLSASPTKGTSISHKKTEDGNGVMWFYADGTGSVSNYVDLSCPELSDEGKYIISTDVFINKLDSGSNYIGLFDGKDSNVNQWRLCSRLYAGGSFVSSDSKGSFGKLLVGEWNNIAYYYRVGAGEVSVYINGELARTVACRDDISPTVFRIDLVAASGSAVDCYLDNIKFYKANQPLPDDYFDEDKDEGEEEVEVSFGYSVLNNSEKAKEYLKGITAFMLTNNYMFVNGTKKEYPENSHFESGGVFMISLPLLKEAFGVEYKENADGTYTVNNKLSFSVGSSEMISGTNKIPLSAKPAKIGDEIFVPLRTMVVDGLGKHLYYDERGFILVSDDVIPYKNSKHLLDDSEPVDDIFRFMQFEDPSGNEIIEDFKKNVGGVHPRILLTNEEINYILDKVETGNQRWVTAYNKVINAANAQVGKVISASPENSAKQGSASGYCSRMYSLSMGYLLTGNEKYAKTAVDNLKAAASWDSLGEQSSQLTSGDWMLGTGMGVDTFYAYMQKDAKGREVYKLVKDAVIRMPYKNMVSYYNGQQSLFRWGHMRDNFAGYICGGAWALALAFADEPDMLEDTAYILENLHRTSEIVIGLFGPDGAWYEGVHYGWYQLQNFAKGIMALYRCCGDTYGLMSAKGIDKAADWYIYLSTGQGSFNFHDMDTKLLTVCTWGSHFAYLSGNYEGMEATKRHFDVTGDSLDILTLMLYDKMITDKGIKVDISGIPLDHYFRVADAGSFRSSLDTEVPTFAAFHGGWTGIYHDMLDLGQFYFEADGIVWACDIGKDNYSLPAYFGIPDGYKLYRKNAQGENVLLINPLTESDYYGQKVDAYAPLIDFEYKNKAAKSAYDLTEAYERDVTEYKRGYYFGDDRNTLTVRDELILKEESEIYWQMHTPAEIQIIDKNNVMLVEGDKKCKVEFACSEGEWEILDMAPKLLPGSPGENIAGQNENSGIRKLALYIRNASDSVTITAKLIPQNENYIQTPVDGNTNISDWTLPDGVVNEPPSLSQLYVDGVMYDGVYPDRRRYEIEIPFGSDKTPEIVAVSDNAEVAVVNSGSLADPVEIILKKEGWKDIVCSVAFVVSSDRTIKITDGIVKGVKPQAGLFGEIIRPATSASSPVPDAIHGAANLIDNDFETRCAIDDPDCWAEIDLGKVYDISGVACSFYEGDKRVQYYDLCYSVDGINYTKVFKGESVGTTSEYETVLIPGKARYIRFLGYGNSTSGWNSITEIRAVK